MGEVFQLLLSPEPQQGILTRTLTTSTLLSLSLLLILYSVDRRVKIYSFTTNFCLLLQTTTAASFSEA